MEKKNILIFNPKLARYLLKKGYRIIDIKPNRDLLNASVFVFINEDNLWDEVANFKENK